STGNGSAVLRCVKACQEHDSDCARDPVHIITSTALSLPTFQHLEEPEEIVLLRTATGTKPDLLPDEPDVFFDILATDELNSFDVIKRSQNSMIVGFMLLSIFFTKKILDAVGEDVFSDLLKVLTGLAAGLHSARRDSDDSQSFTLQLQLTAECFRSLRNSCVQSARNQKLLRVTLLELLLAQLREEGSEGCGVPPSVARFLAGSFQKGCGAVLTLATGSASSNEVLQEALTVISLLDVLCEMTSDHKQFMFLQDHPDLLETTVELLQQVHAIGKASKNIFSATQNFSSFAGEDDPASHSPVVSFKAHLIRLIGNLCHSNTSNQNKVRELDGIPLILDNCNIDSNNPFISQWAIFAIRNLLENNLQNQELVAALERRGPVDYSALRELGFLVEERDGSLLLKPVVKDS
ncbi:hypothetical protein GOODEAATRI_004722, partial [Goodea atripinnis]